MKILVTGACGNMGPHICRRLVALGHTVSALDMNQEGLNQLAKQNIATFCGNLSDREFVFNACKGQDAIIHLAWTFADNLPALMDVDIKGYQHLLDSAVEYKIKHVVNTTTAVSYGKPLSNPVLESQAYLTEQSRNPVYALAKEVTEKLGKIYSAQHDIYVNTIMVWYAYGDVIGGRTLRGMIRDAITKSKIEVPAKTGGSFLQLDDYVSLALAIINSSVKGELFNAGSVYLTWEEVSRVITARVNPQAQVIGIAKDKWTGSAFLADDWPLSTQKAQDLLGFKTRFSKEEAIANLSEALTGSIERVNKELAQAK